MRLLGASIWKLLSHPITVSQSYVMDEDAALEAQAPEDSSPEGELTGKPCSINSSPNWLQSGPRGGPGGPK